MTHRMSLEDLKASLESSPFHDLLGISLVELNEQEDTLVLEMPLREELEHVAGSGQFHGGAIASLIDIAGCYGVSWMVGFDVPTMNFRTDYLRPAVGSNLLATAQVRKLGRSVSTVDVEIRDTNSSVVAIGRGTYSTRMLTS